MKKLDLNSRRSALLLFLFSTLVLFLQSCCCLSGLPTAKSRYCNCGKQNLVAASANDKKMAQPESPPAVFSQLMKPEFVANAAEWTGLKTNEQAVILPVVTTHAQPLQTTSTEESYIAETPFPAASHHAPVKRAFYSLIKLKKLPLAIKAMNTYVVGGPSISFRSNDATSNATHKAGGGFQVGIKSTFTFSESLDLSSGLLFRQNNASESFRSTDYNGTGGTTTREITSDYSFSWLSAPLMAEVKLGRSFTAMAGPEVNLLLSSSVKNSGTKTDNSSATVKAGLDVQAGVAYAFPHSPLMVQLLYDRRLSRLDKNSTGYYYPGYSTGSTAPSSHIQSIQLGIGCAICALLHHH